MIWPTACLENSNWSDAIFSRSSSIKVFSSRYTPGYAFTFAVYWASMLSTIICWTGFGADQFNFYVMHDAQEATLGAYEEEIIPVLEAKSAVWRAAVLG